MPKIDHLKVYYMECGNLMNAAAYDETGQLRTDITTDMPGAVFEFIAGLETIANKVTLESVTITFRTAEGK